MNSIGRALNIHNGGGGGRVLEDPAAFERWKAELAAALVTRQMDPSALVALGRRGFHGEFRFWVIFLIEYICFFYSFHLLGLETHFEF